MPGLVLDIGANRGYSALSILQYARKIRVLSIEPNHEHRWSLLTILLLYPLRFRFRLFAAGAMLDRMLLHIPGDVETGLCALASLDPAEFEKEHIRQQLLEKGIDSRDESVFRKVDTRVVPLDQLRVKPDFIKLDVEGHELQALQGLRSTITKTKPVMLIEMNHPERWMPLVKSLGYSFYYYDASSGVLKNFIKRENPLNLFCIHPGCSSQLTRRIFELSAQT